MDGVVRDHSYAIQFGLLHIPQILALLSGLIIHRCGELANIAGVKLA
jgi:hypothetical protein